MTKLTSVFGSGTVVAQEVLYYVQLSTNKTFIDPNQNQIDNLSLTPITEQEYLELNKPSKGKRISDLTAEYKLDVKEIQSSWVPAEIADGEEEQTTKASMLQELAERKALYQQEKAAIVAE